MKKSAQPASTQSFTEISDIREDIVLFKNNRACIVLSITSVNFSLLAEDEQSGKVFAYAALLNSLSFPIQIIIRSKPLQITPYIASIDALTQKTQNLKLKTYMQKYKEFVEGLVQMSTVLDKQFFIVISYSGLEAGASSLVPGMTKGNSQDTFFEQAQASLDTKAESLLSQIHRLSLQAKILHKEALIKLFYDIYNPDESFIMTGEDRENPIVKGI